MPKSDLERPPLEAVFRSFVDRQRDCEVADTGRSDNKVADFLLFDRKVVCEQKALEEDLTPKVLQMVDDLCRERGIVRLGVRVSVQQIFGSQSDGDLLNHHALQLLSTSLESHFKKANQQIKATKRDRGLSDSFGVLVIGNMHHTGLNPEIASWALNRICTKRKPDGSRAFSSIDYVWYLTLTRDHALGVVRGRPLLPSIMIPRHDSEELSTMMSDLQLRWATYNQVPLHEGSGLRAEDVRVRSAPSNLQLSVSREYPIACRRCDSLIELDLDHKITVEWPRPDLVLALLQCPVCGAPAQVHAADTARDFDGLTIHVHPWLGSANELQRDNWRSYIGRDAEAPERRRACTQLAQSEAAFRRRLRRAALARRGSRAALIIAVAMAAAYVLQMIL